MSDLADKLAALRGIEEPCNRCANWDEFYPADDGNPYEPGGCWQSSCCCQAPVYAHFRALEGNRHDR